MVDFRNISKVLCYMTLPILWFEIVLFSLFPPCLNHAVSLFKHLSPVLSVAWVVAVI